MPELDKNESRVNGKEILGRVSQREKIKIEDQQNCLEIISITKLYVAKSKEASNSP